MWSSLPKRLEDMGGKVLDRRRADVSLVGIVCVDISNLTSRPRCLQDLACSLGLDVLAFIDTNALQQLSKVVALE